MKTICPFCKEELRVGLKTQFVEKVDSSIIGMYIEEANRKLKRIDLQGLLPGAYKTEEGVKGLQKNWIRVVKGMEEYPPLVTILKCMNCDAALSVTIKHPEIK